MVTTKVVNCKFIKSGFILNPRVKFIWKTLTFIFHSRKHCYRKHFIDICNYINYTINDFSEKKELPLFIKSEFKLNKRFQ